MGAHDGVSLSAAVPALLALLLGNPKSLGPDRARVIVEECYGEMLACCRSHAGFGEHVATAGPGAAGNPAGPVAGRGPHLREADCGAQGPGRVRMCHSTYLLARALLVGGHGVAVVCGSAPPGRVRGRPLDPLGVRELAAAVGDPHGEQPRERAPAGELEEVRRASTRRPSTATTRRSRTSWLRSWQPMPPPGAAARLIGKGFGAA